MTVRDDVKKTLAAIEPLRRQLNSADEAWAEIDAVGGVLTARKSELIEVQEWLSRTKAAAEAATAELDELRANSAREEARITGRIDNLKSELLALETAVAERRTEHDAILASISALHRRLVGNAA